MKLHPYQVSITWTGARHGTTKDYASYSREYTVSGEGKADLLGSSDKIFRGDATLYNPEELLLAAISSCHLLWYLHLCADNKIHILSYKDDISGELEIHAGGDGKFKQANLYPHVVIDDPEKISLATELYQSAHQKCFIANSVNFPVECFPQVSAR